MSFKIAVTGGIGSGKSLLSRILDILGIPVYDCDSRARALMTESREIRAELIRLAGTSAYLENGALNKPYLARFLFASQENAQRVNAVVHPRVREDFRQWAIARKEHPIVALESAILYEASFEDEADQVWLVSAPLPLRVQRAVCRDASAPEKVMARVQQQLPEEVLKEQADVVVVNDDKSALWPQIENALAGIRKILS